FGLFVQARDRELVDGGHAGVPGDAVFAHRPPEAHRVEFVGNNHRSTSHEGGEGGGDQPMNMKQRHYAEGNIVRLKIVGPGHVATGNSHVLVHERNAFGTAGAAAGVQHQGHVVSGGGGK